MTKRVDIEPSVWGPSAWVFLDAVVNSFPAEASLSDQLWIADFLANLTDALPCEKCRSNYTLFLRRNPLPMNVIGREQVRTWLARYRNEHKL